MLQLGIIGLPNVGKTTLFNALTNASALAENYPFSTVEPNVGVVAVPDPRLDKLADLVELPKVTPVTVEFVDIAGLVEGASRGEGLGNQFLSHIRQVDAIIHVVRCFDDPDVTHVSGPVDPVRDHDIVTTELALADIVVAERRLEKVRKSARSGNKKSTEEVVLLERALNVLNAGKEARQAADTEPASEALERLGLLTVKPVLYAANVTEDELGGTPPSVAQLLSAIRSHNETAELVPFAAKFEAELVELDRAERSAFLAAVGVEEAGLNRIIRAGYRLLGLVTFFTIGEEELRAWTIPRHTTAYDAAGEIHSDFRRGFIGAETVSWEEFVKAGSYKAARQQGLMRSEGRDYEVKDGEILLIRFNV